MTPRLKILSFFLFLSVIYAIYDYIERNKDDKPAYVKEKTTTKRARTAGVSAQRAIDMKKSYDALKKRQEKRKPKEINVQSNFLPISDDILSLNGWSRNPFVKTKIKKPLPTTEFLTKREEKKEIEEVQVLTTLDGLNIETAVRMGQKAYVTINGQTFREGDFINDAIIEKIEREKITFKIGETRIIKDVGT